MSKKIITHNNGIIETRETFYTEKTIQQLKQQLEESFTEEDVEGLIEDRQKTIKFLQGQLTEKQRTIDEINKEFVQAIHGWKALCAEKDKEIEKLKTKQKPIVMHSKEDYFKRCNFLEEENIKLQFAQKQLAIQELEKVKNFVDGRTYCADYINKRIQELKGA